LAGPSRLDLAEQRAGPCRRDGCGGGPGRLAARRVACRRPARHVALGTLRYQWSKDNGDPGSTCRSL